MQRNEPMLAEVRAPWDAGWSVWDVVKPKNFWRAIVYNRRYKGFWAPSWMERWRYRRLLKDLDEVCLRSLNSQGALTARELADCLNRGNAFRTKPALTGIHRISAATSHDWVSLAWRRGYVAPWGAGGASGPRRGGSHWVLTDRGRSTLHPWPVRWFGRLPHASWAPVAVGALAGALDWLTLHQLAIVLIVYAFLLTLAIAVPHLWLSRWEKRQNPGVALVAIETLRSAGKPLPVL
jgi:hypothetical protein